MASGSWAASSLCDLQPDTAAPRASAGLLPVPAAGGLFSAILNNNTHRIGTAASLNTAPAVPSECPSTSTIRFLLNRHRLPQAFSKNILH